jgi:hypothetical protein
MQHTAYAKTSALEIHLEIAQFRVVFTQQAIGQEKGRASCPPVLSGLGGLWGL